MSRANVAQTDAENVAQTDAEIAANFRRCLADAAKTGTPPPTEQGFDLVRAPGVIRAMSAESGEGSGMSLACLRSPREASADLLQP